MKRILFAVFALLVFQAARAQSDTRILVRGQEMIFESLTLQDGIPTIALDDKSLLQMGELLGRKYAYDSLKGEATVENDTHKARLTPSSFVFDGKEIKMKNPPANRDNRWYYSLPELAKAFYASLTFDSDRNIWYVDSWIEKLSLKTLEDHPAVVVESSSPNQPTFSRLTDPPRVVIDFAYAAILPGMEQVSPDPNTTIARIEIAQFQTKPNIVRIVAELKDPNLQWSNQTALDGRELSVAIVPPATPVFTNSAGGQAGPHSPGVLGEIQLKKSEDESDTKVIADLKFSAPVPFVWRKLKSPDNRVYIDFSNCKKGMGKSIDFDNPYFEEIRVAQFQTAPVPVVRVVLQLRDAYHVDVEDSSEGLELKISSKLDGDADVLTGEGTTGFSAALASQFGEHFSPHPAFRGSGPIIVLDPGHGGSDPGARGRHLVEKEVTLDIAERLEEKLVSDGFRVVLTRTGDHDALGYRAGAKEELQARADIANSLGATMFISIHINSSDYSWPHGVQSHWYKSMDQSLAATLQKRLAEQSGFLDRGILKDRFYVLNHTSVPSTLVEIGFISNAADEAKLADPQVRDRVAEALRQGIVDYSGIQKRL